jgi:prepilin-type N-terminal cleavage/methylation domain-containing protein
MPFSTTKPARWRLSRAANQRRAYTLIEILIVVTLLGIAAALVSPVVGSTDVLRVQSTVRAIVADIAFAQSDALATQSGRAIIFDADANKYTIVEVKGPVLNPATDTMQVVEIGNGKKYGDSKLISAEFDGDAILVFDEIGGPVTEPDTTTPSAGGKITITGSGQTFEITVEAYTGRVTVKRL